MFQVVLGQLFKFSKQGDHATIMVRNGELFITVVAINSSYLVMSTTFNNSTSIGQVTLSCSKGTADVEWYFGQESRDNATIEIKEIKDAEFYLEVSQKK